MSQTAGIDIVDDPPSIYDEWDALAEQLDAPPWRFPGWYEAWSKAFGTGRPRIFCARAGGRLVGVLPMVEMRGELRAAANSETPDYLPLLSEESVGGELARALYARSAMRINLFPVPREASFVVDLHGAAAAAGFSTLDRFLGAAPYVDAADWETYSRQLDAKSAREIRRRRRRLEQLHGDLGVAVEDGSTDLDQLLDRCLALEGSGWKGAAGSAIARDVRLESFYRDLAHWASDRGWLRIGLLRCADRAIAFDLSLERGGRHYLLKTGFDEEYRRWAPGKLLRYEMLRGCFERGITHYEFLGRDEPWKLEWASHARPLVHLRWFPPSLKGHVERLCFVGARNIKQRLSR